MPDTTRTSSSDRLSALKKELVKIAETGLHPGSLAERRGSLGQSFELQRVKSTDGGPVEQAAALVQVILDAIRLMPGERLALEAEAHFGAQRRYRDLPYEMRRGDAVSVWDPEGVKSDESYTRREFPKVREQLAATILDLDDGSLAAQSDFAPPAAVHNEQPTANLRRINCRLESWLTGKGQQQVRSEWTAHDIVIAREFRSTRSRRHARYAHRIEPLSENIRDVANLGVDNYGYTVWQTNFRDTYSEGQEVTWATATIYDEVLPDQVDEVDWISVLVRDSEPAFTIPSATFIAHFDTRFVPRRVVGFEAKKGRLPLIDREIDEVPVASDGVARLEIRNLRPGFNYGLFWKASDIPD